MSSRGAGGPIFVPSDGYDEMPGGHLVALSRPRESVDRLEAYRNAGG